MMFYICTIKWNKCEKNEKFDSILFESFLKKEKYFFFFCPLNVFFMFEVISQMPHNEMSNQITPTDDGDD